MRMRAAISAGVPAALSFQGGKFLLAGLILLSLPFPGSPSFIA
jgi:hypothetical protein